MYSIMRTVIHIGPMMLGKSYLIFLYLLLAGISLLAQGSFISSDSAALLGSHKREAAEVDFLLHYYEQEGQHSAVTGGRGVETLHDYSGRVVVHVPIDSLSRLYVNGGVNYYTSASSDKIDTRVSSASREDVRGKLYMGYTWRKPGQRTEWVLEAGGSLESDYFSSSLGLGWGKSTADGNQDIRLKLKAYFDTWVVIFPEELRGTGRDLVPTDKRNSFSLSAVYSRVINRKLQASFMADIILQKGLLATPFHRVYFPDEVLPRVESLPLHRWKFPIGMRLHYFPLDKLVLRYYARLYGDSFGILALTSSLEAVWKIGPFFSVYPFYRFHVQEAARYFQAYKLHEPGDRFFTSDYDLSAFHSHKFGLGITYTPLYGIGRFRLFSPHRIAIFREIELRYARYLRSDGLNAHMLGLSLGFQI